MSDFPWLLVVATIPLIVGVVLAGVEVLRRPDLTWPRRIVWLAGLVVLSAPTLALYVIARPPRHRAAVAPEVAEAERATAVVDLVERRVGGGLGATEYADLLQAVRK